MAINTDVAQAQPARTDLGPGKSAYAPVGDRSSRFGQTRPTRRRLIALASGLQKTGKDHWAFGAPGPIGLHAFDGNWVDTANKFITEGKIIKPAIYDVPEPTGKAKDSAVQSQARDIWEDFRQNYIWSLDNYRTVVVDTSTEMYALSRLSHFGALSTGETTNFAQVNSDIVKLVREANNHDANVIFLQRLGKKYVNKEWNGDYETKGWNDMSFEVSLVVRLWREDPNIFHTFIEDCTLRPQLNGQDLIEIEGMPFNSFPYIASTIYGNSVSDWIE